MDTCREFAEKARNKIIQDIDKAHVKYGIFYNTKTGREHVVVIIDTTNTLWCHDAKDWQLIDYKPSEKIEPFARKT